MNLGETKRKLWDTTFLLGGLRRKSAIKALAAASDPKAAAILGEAICRRHPNNNLIRERLSELRPPADQAKIDAVWDVWNERRSPELLDFLRELGYEAETPALNILSLLALGKVDTISQDPAAGRDVLGLAGDQEENVQESVVEYAKKLPDSEEFNDEIFAAWMRTGSEGLEAVVAEQQRRPGRIELEALFDLVTGRADEFLSLADPDGVLFNQAFSLANEEFRKRINNTVLSSGKNRLVEAYQRARAARSGFDPKLVLDAYKKAGDDEKLFEATRELTLLEIFDLCEWWAENQSRPSDPARREVVETAVKAFGAIGRLSFEPGPEPPDGLVDIFDWWKSNPPDDKTLRAELDADDPITRARAVFLGNERGIVSREQLRDWDDGEHWPVKFVARVCAPEVVDSEKTDHVFWLNALGGIDGEVLGAKPGGTPEQYEHFSEVLGNLDPASGPIAERNRALLQILCTFMGHWLGGVVEWEDGREATDRRAAVIEDIEDAPIEE